MKKKAEKRRNEQKKVKTSQFFSFSLYTVFASTRSKNLSCRSSVSRKVNLNNKKSLKRFISFQLIISESKIHDLHIKSINNCYKV
jgi:hypothetical protein